MIVTDGEKKLGKYVPEARHNGDDDDIPLISKTIQVRQPPHARYSWRSKDELISDVLLWTPVHGLASVGRMTKTYLTAAL